MSDMESLDKKVVDELYGLMGEDYLSVYEAFERSSNNSMQELEIAIEQKDAIKIETNSHTLKGSSANIGANKFSALCKIIMDAARNNENIDYALHYNNARQEYASVINAIKSLRQSNH